MLALANDLVARAGQFEAQGVKFRNESDRTVSFVLLIDRKKHQIDLEPSSCAYVVFRGQLEHPFAFKADRFSGSVRNLAVEFREREGIATCITEGADQTITVNEVMEPKDRLIEPGPATQQIELLEFHFSREKPVGNDPLQNGLIQWVRSIPAPEYRLKTQLFGYVGRYSFV